MTDRVFWRIVAASWTEEELRALDAEWSAMRLCGYR